jgi:exopolysaccharide production protein ExoZ
VLRGLAALSVAALHAQFDASLMAARHGGDFAVIRFPWEAGVDVFFVISGLIMVHASQNLFGRWGAGRLFLRRRLARIVPLYWLVTTLYLGVALLAPRLLNSGDTRPAFVIASYLFWPAARQDGLAQPLYSLGWTLNYELLFYALFAAGIGLSMRAAVAAVATVLVLVVVLGRTVPLPLPWSFWSEPIVLEFALGMGLGLARSRGLRLPTLLRLILAAAGLLWLAFWPGLVPGRLGSYGLPALLIVAAAALGRDRERPEGFLARVAARIGDASYALYLVHPFVIRGLATLVSATGVAPLLGSWGFVALALLAAAALALATFRYIEQPLVRMARRRFEAGATDSRGGPRDGKRRGPALDAGADLR